MKYVSLLFVALFAVTLVPACCNHSTTVYTVPAGYQRCKGPRAKCPHNYTCGFVGVDTYPVCRYTGPQ